MGGNAEPQAGAADRREVGRVQVLLAEMDVVAAQVDGVLPVIVDDELGAGRVAQLFGRGDFLVDNGGALVLHAQLHQPDTMRQQPRDPGGRVDDEVEGVKHAWLP